MKCSQLGLVLVCAGLFCACSEETNADDPVSQHIGIIEQRVAANNARDWQAWEALHTVDATRTAPDLPEPLVGRAAMRAAIEVLSNAMPDYNLEVLDAFGEGDRLAVRFRARGTFTAPFVFGPDFAIPPNGKSFSQEWVALVRFEGNAIAEFNEFADQYSQFVQLGVLSYFGD